MEFHSFPLDRRSCPSVRLSNAICKHYYRIRDLISSTNLSFVVYLLLNSTSNVGPIRSVCKFKSSDNLLCRVYRCANDSELCALHFVFFHDSVCLLYIAIDNRISRRIKDTRWRANNSA